MSLPIEFLIEDAVRSIGDVIVYRAEHPIHGTVNVYQPDDNLSSDLAEETKNRLYESGLRMRDMSLLNPRFVTKALEVSQNPNEPYVVTKYAKYDLEELINNGVTLKPKRTFVILSQVLEAIVNLAANGWPIDRVYARQVKLPQLHTGNINLTVFEDMEEGISVSKVGTPAAIGEPSDEITTKAVSSAGTTQTVAITQSADETQAQKDEAHAHAVHLDIDATSTLNKNIPIEDARKQLRTAQRNIYILGDITYQLLFGRKYQSSDKLSVANIRKLGRRWRKVLERALSEDIARRYDTYENMLRDLRKASNRNKRLAIASVPFLILLAVIGSYFAYERYREHKIMTSEAGQAIKSFLDIVNETQDEFPELTKPETEPNKPDEQTILSPFDNIKPVDED